MRGRGARGLHARLAALALLLAAAAVLLAAAGRAAALGGSDLLPFGVLQGDTLLPRGDAVSRELLLPSYHSLLFGGRLYQSLFVSTDGAVSLQQPLGAPRSNPLPQLDAPPFFGVFHADVDTRGNGSCSNCNEIYYRYTTRQVDVLRFSALLRDTVPHEAACAIEFGVVVTWLRVGYASSHDNRLNTFQLLVVSTRCGQALNAHTYAYFLYPDAAITWVSGDQFGGTDGLGGAAPVVGINGAAQYSFVSVPFASAAAALELPRMSNVKVPGVFVARVDSALQSEGCARTSLDVFPREIDVLGTTVVTVSGLCTDALDAPAECVFNDVIVVPAYWASSSVLRCTAPALPQLNGKPVSFKVNAAGANGDAPARVLYVSGDTLFDDLGLSLFTDTGAVVAPGGTVLAGAEFIVAWTNDAASVNPRDDATGVLTLWGWTAPDCQQCVDAHERLVLLQTVGSFDRTAREARIRLQLTPDFANVRFAGVFLQFQSTMSTLRTGMRFFASSSADAALVCRNLMPSSNLAAAALCPLSPSAALGNWVSLARDVVDVLHRGADRCYQLFDTEPATSVACCYNVDGVFLASSAQGNSRGLVHNPLRHFDSYMRRDVLSYAACCAASGQCSDYAAHAPRVSTATNAELMFARAWGDPHFDTFDSLAFSFNGFGEFNALTCPAINFAMQLRTTVELQEIGSAGTRISAVAIRGPNTDPLRVELLAIGTVNIYWNGERVEFDGGLEMRLPQLRLTLDRDASVLAVRMSAGPIVFVDFAHNLLAVQVLMPKALCSDRSGLLAYAPAATSRDARSDFADLRSRFALASEAASMFAYTVLDPFVMYSTNTFEPSFDVPAFPDGTMAEQATQLCGAIGTTLAAAMAPGSRLASALAAYTPSVSTLTDMCRFDASVSRQVVRYSSANVRSLGSYLSARATYDNARAADPSGPAAPGPVQGDDGSAVGAGVGAAFGAIGVTGLVLFILYARRRRLLCFRYRYAGLTRAEPSQSMELRPSMDLPQPPAAPESLSKSVQRGRKQKAIETQFSKRVSNALSNKGSFHFEEDSATEDEGIDVIMPQPAPAGISGTAVAAAGSRRGGAGNGGDDDDGIVMPLERRGSQMI